MIWFASFHCEWGWALHISFSVIWDTVHCWKRPLLFRALADPPGRVLDEQAFCHPQVQRRHMASGHTIKKMSVGAMVSSKPSLQLWSHQLMTGDPTTFPNQELICALFVQHPGCTFRAFQTVSNSPTLNASKSTALSSLGVLKQRGCFHEPFLFDWAFL